MVGILDSSVCITTCWVNTHTHKRLGEKLIDCAQIWVLKHGPLIAKYVPILGSLSITAQTCCALAYYGGLCMCCRVLQAISANFH